MAYSYDDPYLVLDDFRRINDQNPFHYNHAAGTGADLNEGQIFIQPELDMIGEECTSAYKMMWDALGYPMSPQWVVDERVKLAHSTVDWHLQQVRLDNGKIIAIGKRATSVIEAAASVTYSSVGGLIDDLATITVTTAVATDEVGVFFKTADGADEAAADAFRIYPVKVVDNGDGTYTITAHRALFLKPTLRDVPYAANRDEVTYDATDASNYVTEVDVYRVYADSTSAVVAVGDSYYTTGAGTNADVETNISARVIDPERGRIQLRHASNPCPFPDYFKVSYRCGVPLDSLGRMDTRHARAFVRLANADMRNYPTHLDAGRNKTFRKDQENMGSQNELAQEWADNPFGIKRGHVAAWQFVWRNRLVKGFAFP